MRPLRTTTLALALAAPFGGAGETQEAVGMRLESAGFTMRPANTPEKMARLRTLPPRKFVVRRKAGSPYYIYADPEWCRCAYVGRQQAMNSYRDMVSPPAPPPGYREFSQNPSASGASLESEMIHDMNEDGETPGEDDIFHPGF